LPGIYARIILMQLSNVCFRVGQIAWRKEAANLPRTARRLKFSRCSIWGRSHRRVSFGSCADWTAVHLTGTHWLVWFTWAPSLRRVLFLVNLGAMRVSAGALAAMNNAKIPLAVAFP